MKSLLVLLALVSASLGVRVIELQTKTTAEGSLNLGNIQVELINTQFQSCRTGDLDGPGNNFQNYQTDRFTNLGNCANFDFPDGVVPEVTVHHTLTDAWGGEWIRVVLEDQTFRECPGTTIDGNNLQVWHCS